MHFLKTQFPIFLFIAAFFNANASITITDTVSNTCNNSGTVKLGATGGTAPYQFAIRGGALQNSGAFTGLGAGTYTFYVIDAVGNIDSINPTITATVAVTAVYNSTQDIITTTVTGGTGPYQYFWPGFYGNAFGDSSYVQNRNNVQPLLPGQYLVQVKDNNGCLGADSVATSASTDGLGFITLIHPGCSSQNDDSIIIDGTGGVPNNSYPYYTYELGTTEIAGFFPNNEVAFTGSGYGLASVIDNDNNLYASYYHYWQPSPLVISGKVTNATSPQQSNGYISLWAYGGELGYRYHWANGITTPQITGLASGSYTVTVTDYGGCSATRTFIIGPPVLSDTIENAGCYGDSTGKVSLGVIGAVNPCLYTLAGGQATGSHSFAGLPAGAYTFYVTDSTGAQDSITATITQPAALHDTATIQEPDTINDGFISLTVTGGTPPYHYSWSVGNDPGNYLGNLGTGVYAVTIADSNDCTITQTYNLNLSGLNQLSGSDIIQVHENPTKGIVTITGVAINQVIEIYDASGRIIYHQPATGNTCVADISGQARGLYLLRILNADGGCAAIGKVIKD